MNRLAILCSGQAGQHAGMLDAIIDAPDLAPLRAAAGSALGIDLGRWWRGLDEAALFRNRAAQFSIAVRQLAHWSRLGPALPPPALVAGYSLGELIAWHVAGALDLAATLALVRDRARLMDEALADATLAAGATPDADASHMLLWRGPQARRHERALRAAAERAGCAVAIERPGGDLVIGGLPGALAALRADATLPRKHLAPLRVTVPSHTRWLARAADAFRAALEAAPLADARCPVLRGTDGRRLRTRAEAIDALARQIAAPLRWDACNDALGEAGITRALELGPGSDLARLAAEPVGAEAARSVDEFRDRTALIGWCDGPATTADFG
ncbi:hypothetical protein [Derxia gummosa]|uniref:Malonyl-CoA:ACP transacylase (MAT) domain-containing protein n=1 Tax=Derxia gummosa DSM 723 TaxID=1121388 RepID=A0A8B6X4D3_9BURK|nr:hypothetical protein [Derxia gummosa]